MIKDGLLAEFDHEIGTTRRLLERLPDDRDKLAWKPHAKPGSRSIMNVTFRGATKQLEEELLARAEERGMTNLRGHRSVGGMRASLYNAFPEDGVRRLVDLLHELDR